MTNEGFGEIVGSETIQQVPQFLLLPSAYPPNIPLHLLVYPSLSVFTRLPLPYLCRQIAPTLLRRIQRCPLSLYTASNYRYFMKLANLFYFRKRRPRTHWLKPKGVKMYIQVHTEKESMEKNATLEKKAILQIARHTRIKIQKVWRDFKSRENGKFIDIEREGKGFRQIVRRRRRNKGGEISLQIQKQIERQKETKMRVEVCER